MFYYIIFSLSEIAIIISELFRKNENKCLRIFFVILGIATLAIVCGIRDYSIGTDTLEYNSYFYYIDMSKGLISYCKNLKSTYDIEYIYSFISYILGKIWLNAHFCYFIFQFLIGGNIYLALNNLKKKISIPLGWITYCFMFYVLSFNALRQSIALSFILLGISFALNEEHIKGIFFIVLATLFHNASIVAFIVYLIILIMEKVKRNKFKYVYLFAFLFAIIFPYVVKYTNLISTLSDKYSNYIVNSDSISLISSLLIRLPMVLLIIIDIWLNHSTLSNNEYAIYLIVFMELIMLPIQNISTAAGRIMLFWGINKIIAYPLVLKDMYIHSSIKKAAFVFLYIIFLAFIFYFQVIVNNNNQVYPFIISSDFL